MTQTADTARLLRDVYLSVKTDRNGRKVAGKGTLVPAGTVVYVSAKQYQALDVQSGVKQAAREVRLPGTLATQRVFETALDMTATK